MLAQFFPYTIFTSTGGNDNVGRGAAVVLYLSEKQIIIQHFSLKQRRLHSSTGRPRPVRGARSDCWHQCCSPPYQGGQKSIGYMFEWPPPPYQSEYQLVIFYIGYIPPQYA